MTVPTPSFPAPRHGWTEAMEAAYGRAGGGVPARVVAEHRSLYRVLSAAGELSARAAGRLRHVATGRGELPAVGDWVLLDAAVPGEVARIREVLPRTSRFSRKVAGARTEEQVVAANVDVVWLLAALDAPLRPRGVERYLSLAWESGALPVVLLTKADLAQDVEGARVSLAACAPGVPVHVVSAVTGAGLEALDAWLVEGRTIALLGPSGAGKSTLLNRLAGETRLRVGPVRKSDGKGRHTTTHRQLVALPSGAMIVDTPGMRELQLWDAEEGIEDAFADVEELGAACRFSDCAHKEEPGCAVAAAVQGGVLDPARLESWRKLVREQARLDRKVDARSAAEEKRRVRSFTRSLRHHPKYGSREGGV